MNKKEKVVVVTGSSRGIGFETSLTLARNGFLTYATMRNLQKEKNISLISDKERIPLKTLQLDVTDSTSVNNAIRSIMDETGRVDVLVNNAGYGLVGAFEELSIEEIKQQFETNFYGAIRVTQAVLPVMRKQGAGIIVNISSGAGRFGYPNGSAYVSSKFALEGLSESMAYEIEPYGLKVVLVEPGFVRTNFLNVVAKRSQSPKSLYSKMTEKMAASVEKMKLNSSPPELVADAVLKAVTSKEPSLRYLVGKDVEQWMEQKKNMSDKEFFNVIRQSLQ